MHGRRDPEPFQDLAGACLEAVAVRLDDQILELGITIAVEVILGVGEDALLLGHRSPERGVAHHHDVEDALVLVLEVILLQDAEDGALRERDVAVVRALLAGQDLEQRGFAAAVRANDAVALAAVELERDALEEHLVAEVFGEVRDRDHDGGLGAPWLETRAGRGAGGRDRADPAAGAGGDSFGAPHAEEEGVAEMGRPPPGPLGPEVAGTYKSARARANRRRATALRVPSPAGLKRRRRAPRAPRESAPRASAALASG